MSKPARGAFTLIEVLVVVAIIALLVAILLPSLSAARDQASSVVCRTRLKELYNGHIYYAQDYKQFFPHYEWWLWDAHPTSWSSPENLGWYTNQHIYDKSGGTWWADSGRWVEYGQIYRYMKNKDVYFCPKDKLRRAGRAIGGGTWGNKPLSSYSSLLEPHNLALGHVQDVNWGNSQFPDATATDFLSIDWIKPKNMAEEAPSGLGQYQAVFASKRFTTTPDHVALLFEEWPNAEGADTLGKADAGAESNQYISMDNATSFPTLGDFMAMRHMGRSNFVYYDGHVATTRKGAEPNWHANGYAGEVLMGASKN
jgi:prepilin-type N-terminal cleavage/methylation domain-containing protein/prepilin-type processing-associated H-X9-DG protein